MSLSSVLPPLLPSFTCATTPVLLLLTFSANYGFEFVPSVGSQGLSKIASLNLFQILTVCSLAGLPLEAKRV